MGNRHINSANYNTLTNTKAVFLTHNWFYDNPSNLKEIFSRKMHVNYLFKRIKPSHISHNQSYYLPEINTLREMLTHY